MTPETLLGYMALVGLLLTPTFALLHGYYVVTAPVVGEADNPLLTPTGPSITVTGIQTLSPGVTIITGEYRTTSTLLWGTVVLTAVAILGRVFLHVQNICPEPDEDQP